MRNRYFPLQKTTQLMTLISLVLLSFTVHAEPIKVDNKSLAEIYNFHKVNAAHYSSGQPTESQLSQLAASGFKAVINLRPHSEFGDSQERKILEAAGVEYHNIAIHGAKGFTETNVKALDEILSKFDPEQKVLLHCASANRVGAMMALRANWLQGASKEEALAIGEQYGMKSLKAAVVLKLK